jgi:hypothetical protein
VAWTMRAASAEPGAGQQEGLSTGSSAGSPGAERAGSRTDCWKVIGTVIEVRSVAGLRGAAATAIGTERQAVIGVEKLERR